MTARMLIKTADELVENPFPTRIKLQLVNEIERKVLLEIRLGSEADFAPIGAEQLDEALQLADAWGRVYLAWMMAQYYWLMGEAEAYENEKAMFDAVWLDLMWYEADRSHKGSGAPEQSYGIREEENG